MIRSVYAHYSSFASSLFASFLIFWVHRPWDHMNHMARSNVTKKISDNFNMKYRSFKADSDGLAAATAPPRRPKMARAKPQSVRLLAASLHFFGRL